MNFTYSVTGYIETDETEVLSDVLSHPQLSKTGLFSLYESLDYFLPSVCAIIPVIILKQLHML